MRTKAVIGLKPGVENSPLIELTRSVLDPAGEICLVSLVHIGTHDDELERLDHVRKQVETTAALLREAGYQLTTEVQVASPGLGSELARIAERHGADLLVIGLAKRSRVGKALLGSDAQSAIMHAPCPVLATRIPT